MSAEHTVWTDQELTAWLDEGLPAERMTELEQQLRTDESLKIRLGQLIRHRDQGGHSVGEVWRRGRLSCPSRSELGGYLLGTLATEQSDYIDFHLLTVGCRLCQANLQDLQEHQKDSEETGVRRRRIFESSAGYLDHDDPQSF
jgi:hypothetical protein